MLSNAEIRDRLTRGSSQMARNRARKIKRVKPDRVPVRAPVLEPLDSSNHGGKFKISNIVDFLKGRPTDLYPPKIRKFIETHGDAHIVAITVGRTPLTSTIEKILNVLTFGNLKKRMAELNIDKLRHLYVILEISDGSSTGSSQMARTRYMFEKDEVIKVSKYSPRRAEELIEPGPPGLNPATQAPYTIRELFETLLAEDPTINIYDSIRANCQGFVAHVLKILGVWQGSVIPFVKQNTNQLLSPFVQKINAAATNAARNINVLIEGAGEDQGGCGTCHNTCGGSFDPTIYRNATFASDMRSAVQVRALEQERSRRMA